MAYKYTIVITDNPESISVNATLDKGAEDNASPIFLSFSRCLREALDAISGAYSDPVLQALFEKVNTVNH